VTFRVTTAIALLLEDDVEPRLVLRRRLAKVYGLRSKVVHGVEIPLGTDIQAVSDEAIRVAVEALRALFLKAPKLIADRERGLNLILSGGRSTTSRP
jgi:hypothetical protein